MNPTVNRLPTPWQARQAAMLYHYASLDYLRGLQRIVTDTINGVVDPLLDLAQAQGRDAVLMSVPWGSGDAAENWANHAWPFLNEVQSSLARNIAMRASSHHRLSSREQAAKNNEQVIIYP